MKARLIIATMLLVFAGGAALAESYQIRVTWPVRLRASYSLDSPIVAKALAGDVLQVVGRFNRWLKIDRNGETAWLADWVDYTRLDQQQEPSPATEPAANKPAPSDIDNCCFVNRNCQTDQEWVDGYWAYQRSECPAPAQLQISSPHWSTHGISIEGSDLFFSLMKNALDYLQARSQKWYAYIVSVVDRIIEKDDPTFFGAALTAQRTVLLTAYRHLVNVGILESDIQNMLTTLAHEACHIHRYEAGFEYVVDPGLDYDKSEEFVCNQVECEIRQNVFYKDQQYCPTLEDLRAERA